ncbi:MAG TPA: radical SAM protein, partial [bacterium]|nr:radical SAM protein [bacterium]
IVSIIKKDIPFFKTSGGGVTLSGGEPTLFTDFCAELLDECKKLSVNTLIETSGMFDPAAFTDLLLPLLDTVFFDLKIYDSKTHKEKCGVGNEVILNNFKRLNETCRDAAGPRLLGRIPLIPGITDTDENLEALAAFLRECGAGEVSLLPYNPTWLNKSAMVDAELRYDNSKWMSEDDLKRCRSHFKGFAII